jgi:hypothetical protein
MACISALTDEALLDGLQRAAFGYFLQAVNSSNGLVADTSRENAPVSIAVVGFALSAYPVAVEHGWMTRADAVERILIALRFFRDSDQSGGPEATGYQGFYYHFLDLNTGGRVWRSELSMIDTALLIAGVLTASMYFNANTPDEIELRELGDALYRRIDWRWAEDGGAAITQGWKPECGFLHYGWEGYNEAIVLYVLALGSPTHPLSEGGYKAGLRPTSGKICMVTIFFMRGRFSFTSSRTPGLIFVASRIASCVRSDAIILRTADARLTCSANTRGATRTDSPVTARAAGAFLPVMVRSTTYRRQARCGRACSAMPRVACRMGRTTEQSRRRRHSHHYRLPPRSLYLRYATVVSNIRTC